MVIKCQLSGFNIVADMYSVLHQSEDCSVYNHLCSILHRLSTVCLVQLSERSLDFVESSHVDLIAFTLSRLTDVNN